MKLSRKEKAVLLLDYDRGQRISLEAVLALGLKTTAVPTRLERKHLLQREPFCGEHLLWTRTEDGERVRRLLIEKRHCDWCGEGAVGSVPVAKSNVTVYFCDQHADTARRNARGRAPAFEKSNVGNSVFGHQAVKKATREAAAA